MLALLLLSSCSLAVPAWPDAPTVECQAASCPTDDDARTALALAADISPELDPAPPLVIAWTEPEALAPDVSFTTDERHVFVASWAGFFHERWHAHFFSTGDHGDGNHSAPPGPWTDETFAVIEEAKNAWQGAQ